jgi:ATP-dependent Lon protease
MRDENSRQELLAKREQLKERLKAVKKDVGRGLDKNLEDQAVQLENADVLDEIARVTTSELARIEKLLSEAEV